MSQQRRDFIISASLLGAVVVLALLSAIAPANALRTWLVVATLSTAPGWACVAFRSPARTGLAWSYAIGLSLASSMLVSLGLLLAHAWHPVPAFWVLLAVTAAVLVWHLVRLRRGVRT